MNYFKCLLELFEIALFFPRTRGVSRKDIPKDVIEATPAIKNYLDSKEQVDRLGTQIRLISLVMAVTGVFVIPFILTLWVLAGYYVVTNVIKFNGIPLWLFLDTLVLCSGCIAIMIVAANIQHALNDWRSEVTEKTTTSVEKFSQAEQKMIQYASDELFSKLDRLSDLLSRCKDLVK